MNNEDVNKELHDSLLEIIDSVSDVVVIFDSDSRVIMANRAMCNLVRIQPEELIGKTSYQLLEEGYIDKMLIPEAIKLRREVIGMHRTRYGLESLSHCRPIFKANGDIKFVVLTSTVLTELDEIKAMLERERRQSDVYLREIEHLRKIMLLEEDFIFESPSMRTVLETVKKVSCMDCTVLITGESGVGKEVIAKIIHNNSHRKDAPFIPVSIPAIPEKLLESELFGYEGGAFTGALKGGKLGLFEIAKNGTLFLDEVGDIPIGMQVKLLRAIENGEIIRVGGIKTIKLDVRIIAATNRNLPHEIKRGNFREDLFYRLNVVPIRINPLKERLEDIWPLCVYFLNRMNYKYNTKKEFSSDALEDLKNRKWPGNVRELRNVVERLGILSQNDKITVEDIQTLIGFTRREEKTSSSAWSEYESYEQSRILSAMKQANGNKSQAAKILGMHRSKLYRKLNP